MSQSSMQTVSSVQLPELAGWVKKKDHRLTGWEKRFVKLSENKVLIFTSEAPGLAPTAHLALTEHVTIEITDPQKFEFRISGYHGKEYLFRASSDQEMQQWVDTLVKSQQIEQTQQQKLIEIHLLDGNKIPVVVNPKDNTAEDVWWAVCEFLELPSESRSCFFIWAVGEELNLLLRNEDNLVNIQNDWAAIEDQFHVKKKGMVKFYFKRAITVSLAYERKLKDPRTIHLLYIQALYHVKEVNYILTEEDIVFLDGIEAQIKFGNYDSTKHSNYVVENLDEWVPKYLQRRRSPNTWQNLIVNEHQKHVNKSRLILKLLYLQFLRQKPYYGAIFFRCSHNKVKQQGAGFFDQDIESSLVIGVNMEGLHVFTYNDAKLLRSFSFTDISQWSVAPNGGIFYFKALNRNRNVYEIFVLETPRALIILDVILDVVFELNRQRLAIREVRKAQKAETRRQLLQQSSTPLNPSQEVVVPLTNREWNPAENAIKNPLRHTPSHVLSGIIQDGEYQVPPQ